MTVSLRFFYFLYGQIEVDVIVRLPHEQHDFNRRSSLLLPRKELGVCAASMWLPLGCLTVTLRVPRSVCTEVIVQL